MTEVNIYNANVFLPGCLGPVRREVVLADDHQEVVQALRAENERLNAFFACCERIVEQLEDSPKSAFKRLRDAVKEVENAH